jgi:hypothetical protein
VSRQLEARTPDIRKTESEVATAVDGSAALREDSDIARLAELVQRGDIAAARELAARLSDEWPESERVQHWARVLAPPVATSRPAQRSRSFDREHAWLREHAREYPGCWLALLGDILLAADPDPRKVMARTSEMEGGSGALIHFQPPLSS